MSQILMHHYARFSHAYLHNVSNVLIRSYIHSFLRFGSELQAIDVSKAILKFRDLRLITISAYSTMSLPQDHSIRTYQVVVAATRDMGIGKDGKLPWKLPSDLKFFKNLTLITSDPKKKNAVVMGRKTWESIPRQYRPLPGRLNVVMTRSGAGSVYIENGENVVICESIPIALKLLAESSYTLSIEKVFVVGGGEILREALNGEGCEAIHISEIETNIECDTFIPRIDSSSFRLWYSSCPIVENNIRYSFVTYVRVRNFTQGILALTSGISKKFGIEDFTFLPKMLLERHDEYNYLRLVQEIILSGTYKDDRIETGTLSKLGCQMQFNLRKSFPLLTTKKVCWRKVVEELLRFVSGSTNYKEKDIRIGDGNLSRGYLDSHDLTYTKDGGDLRPTHESQWRYFGARYANMHADYTGQELDQLLEVIEKIKNTPNDKWNVSDFKLISLPPCPVFAQFHVADGELSCQIYQQSADMGLSVPLSIASYALLTHMIAHVCGLVPGDLIHIIGDAHINETHIKPLQEQLHKIPKPFPILKINPQKWDINLFEAADFQLVGYDPHQ